MAEKQWLNPNYSMYIFLANLLTYFINRVYVGRGLSNDNHKTVILARELASIIIK